jgi:hypothetical protein
MGARSHAVADELEQAADEFARAVASCTDAHWSSVCGPEGWTVAQTAQHLSGGFSLEMEYVTALAEGRPLPAYSWDDINRLNDDRAAKNASITRDEVLNELRAGMASTSAYIRALTDEQLDRTAAFALADGASVSTQSMIERVVLTDHFRRHLKSMLGAD